MDGSTAGTTLSFIPVLMRLGNTVLWRGHFYAHAARRHIFGWSLEAAGNSDLAARRKVAKTDLIGGYFGNISAGFCGKLKLTEDKG
jgi:hypothetical protein